MSKVISGPPFPTPHHANIIIWAATSCQVSRRILPHICQKSVRNPQCEKFSLPFAQRSYRFKRLHIQCDKFPLYGCSSVLTVPRPKQKPTLLGNVPGNTGHTLALPMYPLARQQHILVQLPLQFCFTMQLLPMFYLLYLDLKKRQKPLNSSGWKVFTRLLRRKLSKLHSDLLQFLYLKQCESTVVFKEDATNTPDITWLCPTQFYKGTQQTKLEYCQFFYISYHPQRLFLSGVFFPFLLKLVIKILILIVWGEFSKHVMVTAPEKRKWAVLPIVHKIVNCV